MIIKVNIYTYNTKQTSPEDVMEFFNQFGEIKYLRMTSNDTDIIKSALIEFTDQSSVANALQNTGTTLNGSQLMFVFDLNRLIFVNTYQFSHSTESTIPVRVY